MNQLWLAKDDEGTLWLFNCEPEYSHGMWSSKKVYEGGAFWNCAMPDSAWPGLECGKAVKLVEAAEVRT
jgi:hypothetical protein